MLVILLWTHCSVFWDWIWLMHWLLILYQFKLLLEEFVLLIRAMSWSHMHTISSMFLEFLYQFLVHVLGIFSLLYQLVQQMIFFINYCTLNISYRIYLISICCNLYYLRSISWFFLAIGPGIFDSFAWWLEVTDIDYFILCLCRGLGFLSLR